MKIRSYFLLVHIVGIISTAMSGQEAILGVPFGHTDLVHSLSFSADGRLLLSASSDNTLRIWDAELGKLLKTKTIVSYGDLVYGRLSPDGEVASYAYYVPGGSRSLDYWNIEGDVDRPLTDSTIYFPPNHNTTVLPPNIVSDYHVGDISADGQYAVLVHREHFQTSLWDLKEQKLVLNYNEPLMDKGYIFGIPDASFSPDGKKVYRGTPEGIIVVYEALTGNQIQELRGHTKSADFIHFMDGGKKLLIANGQAEVRIWDLTTGQIKKIGDSPDQAEPFIYFQILHDRKLLRAKREDDVELVDLETGNIEVLNTGNEKKLGRYLGYSEPLSVVFFRKENFVNILFLSNHQVYLGNGNNPLRHILPDGLKGIAWSNDEEYNTKPFIIDLKTGEVTQTFDAIKYSFWRGGRTFFPTDHQQVLIRGDFKTIDNVQYAYLWDLQTGKLLNTIEESGAGTPEVFAFSNNNRYLIMGTWEGSIVLQDLKTGATLHSVRGHEGKVLSLAFSPDDQKIYSTAEDGTIKIWNFDLKQKLASLIQMNEDDWVVTTPSGVFDASPKAMELMFYKADYQDKTEVIDLEQLKIRYRDPGLLQKLIGKNEEAIRNVEGLSILPLHPEVNGQIVDDQLNIKLLERNGKIGRVSVFINEQEVEPDISDQIRGDGPEKTLSLDLKPYESKLFSDRTKINRVSIEATNQEGWLTSRRLEIVYPKYGSKTNNSSQSDDTVPNMHIVCIGTSNYAGNKLDLKYADQDASAMAKALHTSAKQLFDYTDGVSTHCLTTQKEETVLKDSNIQWSFPNKENIIEAFRQVEQKAKPEDILVVFFAGHGVTYGQGEQVQFYYLTEGVADERLIEIQDTRQKYAISTDELTERLKDIDARKQVLILDACNSGKAVDDLLALGRNLNSSQIRAIDRMQDRTGIFILSGSAADKASYESSEFGQGLLTYALLNGMQQGGLRTDQNGVQFIDVMRLFNYARDEVPELATSIQGVQIPTIGYPNKVSTIDIGIFNEQVDIPLIDKKSILINPILLNQNNMEDDLKLNQLLSNAFAKESEKGKNADFLFSPLASHPNAIQITGLYEVINEQIHLKAKLKRPDGQAETITLGPIKDAGQLIKLLMKTIKENL